MSSIPAELRTAAEQTERPVTLGDWSLLLRGDQADDLHYRGIPVLRSLRVIARDTGWNTPEAVVDRVEQSESTLTISGHGELGELSYRFDFSLTVDGTDLVVSADIEALTTFESNRIGLIILLPPSAAGAPFRVRSADGTVTPGALPVHISPHQPAFDITGFEWSPEGLDAAIEVSGDVFEMEDQRNWTDASFKIYSTPLSLPFPVSYASGQRVQHRLRLSATERGAAPAAAVTDQSVDLATAEGVRAPEIGLLASTAPDSARPEAPASSAAFLLVELDARWPQWSAALTRAHDDAAGRPLDVRLFVSDVSELDAPVEAIAALGEDVRRVGVFDRDSGLSTVQLLNAAEAILSRSGASATRVGGTWSNFTELNRGEEALTDWSGPLAFSVRPTVHDLGGHQLVESVGIQRRVRDDATRIADGRPLHIGPVTLRSRSGAATPDGSGDAAATGTSAGYGAEFADDSTDPRQTTLAAASWLLASVAQLSGAGVHSVILGEEWGSRGLTAAGRRAIDWVSWASGRPALDLTTQLPGVYLYGTQTADGPEVIVANLSADDVLIDGASLAGSELLSGGTTAAHGTPDHPEGALRVSSGDSALVLLEAGSTTLRLRKK
ncbi:MAG: hypothetical protein ACTJHU_10015 [Mycetocola sp.]